MAKTIGLTDSELKAVKSTWALVMSTNIAETAAGLLLTFAFSLISICPLPIDFTVSLDVYNASLTAGGGRRTRTSYVCSRAFAARRSPS